LMGTFGATTIRVPRARLTTPEGKTAEWRNATIPAYQRRTKRADALIAGAYLSGTNTRRVRRALAALFGGAVGTRSAGCGARPKATGTPRMRAFKSICNFRSPVNSNFRDRRSLPTSYPVGCCDPGP
jgi:transposase-like protein